MKIGLPETCSFGNSVKKFASLTFRGDRLWQAFEAGRGTSGHESRPGMSLVADDRHQSLAGRERPGSRYRPSVSSPQNSESPL
jgi:hypothetical protein